MQNFSISTLPFAKVSISIAEGKRRILAISTAAAAGIVNGYEDGTFRPNNAITRAEFAAIASRFANVPYDGEEMFSDIADHWAKDNINEAAIVGWINGYEDGTYKPENTLTRAEAATLIYRLKNIVKQGIKFVSVKVAMSEAGSEDSFMNFSKIKYFIF